MKKSIFIIFILISVNYSTGYAQFFDSSTIWSEANAKYYFNVENDTILNSTNYHVIKKYTNDTTFHYSNGSFYAIVREENRKIFWLNSDGEEKLLYDFTLNQGDSVYITSMSIYDYGYDSTLLICEAIDTIIDLDEHERQRFKMRTSDPSPYYNTDIEYWVYGIGSTLGFFNSGHLKIATMDQQDPLLYCCHKNINIVYHDENQSSCHQSTLNIEVAKKNLVEIYPNPVLDYLIIKTENEIETIHIHDIKGKVVVKNKGKYLDLSTLNKGTYTIFISFKNGENANRKIVKL